jgi:GrpB-like predicted nucleotidyltransferase (UPF0157 family)
VNDQDSLLAAIYEKVELHDYDPAWPARYAEERDRLNALLPGIFIEVQHIGSTAVPNLPAKPVIDILAGVESMSVAEAVAPLLCQSGYTTSAEFNESLVDRKWFMRWFDGHRTHHLHVVVHASSGWSARIRFRDALRADPELAHRYAKLKSELATKHAADREEYTEAKAEFVRSVLEDA